MVSSAKVAIDLDQICRVLDRLSAAGYAEFHPISSDSTAEGRAENGRVDLVEMPRTVLDLSATGVEAPVGASRKIID